MLLIGIHSSLTNSITVMASNRKDEFAAEFSNYGRCAHIIAPVSVISLFGIYLEQLHFRVLKLAPRLQEICTLKRAVSYPRFLLIDHHRHKIEFIAMQVYFSWI